MTLRLSMLWGVLAAVAVIAFMGTQSVYAQEETTDDTTTEETTTDDSATDDTSESDEEADEDESEEADPETIAALLEMVQVLMARLEELREQMGQTRREVGEVRQEVRDARAEIRSTIEEGMSGEDIERIQELLASDDALYPEGIVSGYFGPLTRQALRRFQARYELEVTGEVDEETEAALETLLEERFGTGQVPPGLLNAPGIKKKFEARLRAGCDNSGPGKAPFCRKVKIKYKWEDGAFEYEEETEYEEDEDDSSDDEDEDDELEIEAEVEDGVVEVEVEYADGTEETFTYDFTTEAAVIEALVEDTDLSEAEIEDVIEFEYENDDDEDDDDEDDDDEEDDDEDDDDEEDDSDES